MQSMDEIKAAEAHKITDDIRKLVDLEAVRQLVEKNEFEFHHHLVNYKVTPGNFKQRSDARKYKSSQFFKYLQTGEYQLESNFKKILKEKHGIDLDSYDSKARTYSLEREKVREQLGKLLTSSGPNEKLADELKEKIEEFNDKITELYTQKAKLLENTVETQCNLDFYQFLASQVLQKRVSDENWGLAFSTFDDFLNAEEELIHKSLYYVSAMVNAEQAI